MVCKCTVADLFSSLASCMNKLRLVINGRDSPVSSWHEYKAWAWWYSQLASPAEQANSCSLALDTSTKSTFNHCADLCLYLHPRLISLHGLNMDPGSKWNSRHWNGTTYFSMRSSYWIRIRWLRWEWCDPNENEVAQIALSKIKC